MSSPRNPGNGVVAIEAMSPYERAKLKVMATLEEPWAIEDLFPALDDYDPGYGRKLKENQQQLLTQLRDLEEYVLNIKAQLSLANGARTGSEEANSTTLLKAFELVGLLHAMARSFSYESFDEETGEPKVVKNAINKKLYACFKNAAEHLSEDVSDHINESSLTGLEQFLSSPVGEQLFAVVGAESIQLRDAVRRRYEVKGLLAEHELAADTLVDDLEEA